MAELPPLRGAPPALTNVRSRAAKDQSSALDTPEAKAEQAQRSAAREIEAANQSIDAARHEADTRIDQIKDYFDARSEEEYAQQEAAFERQRLKGYERLKDLRREQDKMMDQSRREGDRELDKLQTYYRDTNYNTEKKGQLELKNIELAQARDIEFARQSMNADIALQHGLYQKQYDDTMAENDARLAKLQQDTAQEYERLRKDSTDATQKAQDEFEAKYQTRVKTNDDTLMELENRASEGIREVRRDTSQKLAAYSSRQGDPFYRMLDLGVRVYDDGDAYVLTATIPEHEQKHVSVAIKGSQLVLTGYRRNEEKLELEPGREQGTNSFQSYLETFPINFPVDAMHMTKRFEGDQLIARIPKKTEYAYHSEAQSKVPVTRSRLERPRFPENIPHVSQDPYAESSDGSSTGKSKKDKGSGTLT